MKKAIILLAVCAVGLLSFNTIKLLKAEGEVQQWQNVMDVIEQSNAPYQQVKAAKEFLLPQLQKQLMDTTKKRQGN